MSTPFGRARESLREATAAAHHALDHHPLLQRLTRNDLTREQYGESLAALYRPHVLLEGRVHESSHYLPSGLALSARRALLEADLLEMGWSAPAVSTPDAVEGRAAWWGRVYVLEGSRQGGAAIARCLEASLGDAVPRRFFAELKVPEDRSPLLTALEHGLERGDDLEQAAASAQAAFSDFQRELDSFDGGTREGSVPGPTPAVIHRVAHRGVLG